MDTKTIRRYLAKRYWLEANYGILSRIAQELGVSRVCVHGVFWGKETSKRVRAALKVHGAPMFDDEPAKKSKSVKVTA